MGRMHHKKGCLSCGKLRPVQDIMDMTYDVMLKDEVSNSIIRVGLCPGCFGNYASLDLDTLKEKLEESEVCFCQEKGRNESEADVFKNARFVGIMTRTAYWAAIQQTYPNGPQSSSDYLGVITNAR